MCLSHGGAVPPAPFRVRWTAHALEKSWLLDVPQRDVERAVIERHHVRRRNARSADWRVRTGRLVIVYSHPDHGDDSTARIVTLWRWR
jgi:hypothetical protein